MLPSGCAFMYCLIDAGLFMEPRLPPTQNALYSNYRNYFFGLGLSLTEKHSVS